MESDSKALCYSEPGGVEIEVRYGRIFVSSYMAGPPFTEIFQGKAERC